MGDPFSVGLAVGRPSLLLRLRCLFYPVRSHAITSMASARGISCDRRTRGSAPRPPSIASNNPKGACVCAATSQRVCSAIPSRRALQIFASVRAFAPIFARPLGQRARGRAALCTNYNKFTSTIGIQIAHPFMLFKILPTGSLERDSFCKPTCWRAGGRATRSARSKLKTMDSFWAPNILGYTVISSAPLVS